VLWSCNWNPITRFDWIETGVRQFQAPVVFTNGWIRNEKDEVFIYYASSDTRMHVATSSIERLVDYCMNTPVDGYHTHDSVKSIVDLVTRNQAFK